MEIATSNSIFYQATFTDVVDLLRVFGSTQDVRGDSDVRAPIQNNLLRFLQPNVQPQPRFK